MDDNLSKDYLEEVGRKLKDIRIKANISNMEARLMFELLPAELQEIENGTLGNLNMKYIEKLSNMADLPITYFTSTNLNKITKLKSMLEVEYTSIAYNHNVFIDTTAYYVESKRMVDSNGRPKDGFTFVITTDSRTLQEYDIEYKIIKQAIIDYHRSRTNNTNVNYNKK